MRDRGPPGEPLGLVEALILVAASFVLLPVIGGLLQLRLGVGGVALTELLVVLLPSLLVIGLARVSARGALGLVLPSPGAIAGAALCAVGGFYLVAGGLEVLQEKVTPVPTELREQLHDLLLPREGARPLVIDLLALAVAPAVCEEALFRGVLLRALAPSGRTAALLLAAFAFGAFHYSLFKLLPTAALGVLLGALALRSRSLVPSVIAHALNNTLVILLYRSGYEDPPGAGTSASVPWLALSAAAVVAGLLLVGPVRAGPGAQPLARENQD